MRNRVSRYLAPALAFATVLLAAASARAALVCPTPPDVIVVPSPTPVVGDTTGGSNTADVYTCADSAYGPPGPVSGYTGPEKVYEFTLAASASVSFVFSPSSPDLHLFLLGACDEGTCRYDGGCAENLAPGTYRLVVDGLNGAQGRYSFIAYAGPPASYLRWYDCPTCLSAQCNGTPATIDQTRWSFDDENFCGTGCNFSMYAVVDCGSELHLPFSDVETGHMQVYDLLRQQFVNLTATNVLAANPGLPPQCELTSTGTLVQWEDNSCTQIPCPVPHTCRGGMDCRTNDVVMDVSFAGTSSLCGVYRLDFVNWGGYVWDLYSNCDGSPTERFHIYRDQCSAVAHYDPLPEGSIDGLTLDLSQCSISLGAGTLDVRNAGCSDVTGLEIVIEQCPPDPPNPMVYRVDVPAGGLTVWPWTYPITSQSSNLRFSVDPARNTLECSDNLGGCQLPGSRLIACTPVCSPRCQTVASAGPDATVCEGADSTIDASGSVFTCLPGGVAEYRFESAGGQAVPACDWGPSFTCLVPAALLPPGSNLFTVRTRCAGSNPPCVQADTVTIEVVADLPPPALANLLRAVKRTVDARFEWSAIPAPAFALYRLYKDANPQLPGASRAVVADVPSVAPTPITEANAVTLPPTPIAYYQLATVSCSGIVGPY